MTTQWWEKATRTSRMCLDGSELLESGIKVSAWCVPAQCERSGTPIRVAQARAPAETEGDVRGDGWHDDLVVGVLEHEPYRRVHLHTSGLVGTSRSSWVCNRSVVHSMWQGYTAQNARMPCQPVACSSSASSQHGSHLPQLPANSRV